MRYAILYLGAIYSLLSIPAVRGQSSVVMHHAEGMQIGVEYLRPAFSSENIKYSFLSSVWFVSGRFPLSPRLAFVADIPISHANPTDVQFGETSAQTMIGNPYIGIELENPYSSYHVQFGSRIPIANRKNPLALEYAFFGDFNRFEAFAADLVPLNLKVGYRELLPSGLYVNVLVGPTGMISTNTGVDPEIFLDLDALIGYDNDLFRAAGGISSRILLTEAGGNIKERTVSHVIIQASFVLQQFRPGVLVRVPLDEDLREILDVAFGLTLVVDLER